MRYTIPDYYGQFQCAASACKDTCCAGWQIVIDKKALDQYGRFRGPFGTRLKNSINWKEACFKQYNRRCAFLNEENLCDIYQEAGPKMLCRTCRNYPRHIEEFDGIREISLSLSCQEAAMLILGREKPIKFLSKDISRIQEKGDYSQFDFFLYTKLMDSRDVIFAILQNRDMDIRTRISMVLALAHDLQRRIQSQQLYLVDELLERYKRDNAPNAFEKKLVKYKIDSRQRYEPARQMFRVFSQMEVLKESWPGYVEGLKGRLYEGGLGIYEKNRYRFQIKQGLLGIHRNQWSVWCEQLMVYFIYTYFCGAAYDGQAYGKMKFAVASTLLILEMAQGVWQNVGEINVSDLAEIAHRYAKEVEHSDQNLNCMESFVMKQPVFHLENLIRMTESL